MNHIRYKELKVISLFRGDYKGKYYLREISKLTKLPLKTCQNALENLEKDKILKSKVEGKNKYFSLNLEKINTKSHLLKAEIYSTDSFLEVYPQFKLFVKGLDNNLPIIIFGSFAKLTAEKNSDVDLLIISEKEIQLDFHLLPSNPHKISMTEKTFRKAIKEQENLIKEIEENHIILNNHSFYVNTMWSYYAK